MVQVPKESRTPVTPIIGVSPCCGSWEVTLRSSMRQQGFSKSESSLLLLELLLVSYFVCEEQVFLDLIDID